ncbi:hypothetical protein ACRAWG_08775 [Methylobacterium sp. P31]
MSKVWMPALLDLLLCGSVAACAWASGLPALDIRSVCAPERRAGSAPVDRASYRGCLVDEHAARRKLIAQWTTFGARERRVCRQESEIGGAPSYVAILTCLQLGSDDLPVQPSFGRSSKAPAR